MKIKELQKQDQEQMELELIEVPIPGKLKELRNEMEFYKLLSKNPSKLAKKHPQINAQYLPVGVVEQMLDAIFPAWSWEGVNTCIMANSIVYEGVLTVKNPHNDKTYKRSGAAGIPIQLSKGSRPMEIDNIVATAIQKNLPTAKSIALKNAAQSLGNMFGRMLNRDDDVPDMTNLWSENGHYQKLFDESNQESE